MEKSQQDMIDFYCAEIKKHSAFLESNAVKLDIYEGNLLPKVQHVMKCTLNKNYYEKIEKRIIPINVLTRIVNKLAKVYITPPMRITKNKNEADNRLMKDMAEDMDIDVQMSLADEYSTLFKGFAIRPFLDEGKPGIRILPYDRFIALALDKTNPMRMTDYLECMGKFKDSVSGKDVTLWHAYTKEKFLSFTSDGKPYDADMVDNGGINPVGRIPAIYGNRSRQSICPTEDTDITQMTIMIPVLLSDLAGAIMFQCFTIIYGINVKFKNLVMSPNAFWSFQSDPKSDKEPKLGTIKPEADIDKALNFIKQVLAFWLETKGVRIGSMNSMDAANVASGISKIIDEMDVYEVKKQQINFFRKEEKEFWLLMKEMLVYWTKAYPEFKHDQFSTDFQPYIEFDEPRPEVSRATQVETITKECEGGFLDKKSAIVELYPNLGPEELKARFEALGLGEIDIESFKSEAMANFMLRFLESLSDDEYAELMANREAARAAASSMESDDDSNSVEADNKGIEENAPKEDLPQGKKSPKATKSKPKPTKKKAVE